MTTTYTYNGKPCRIDLSAPIDISIPLRDGASNVNAWGLEPPRIAAHEKGHYIGKVTEGASVNFNDVWFNPHAHGTHTECVGHITPEFHSIQNALEVFFFETLVITIRPERQGDDRVITRDAVRRALDGYIPKAVVIRTLPNTDSKLTRHYSHTNPPYLAEEAAAFLADNGVDHLLIDLPSVDPEKDGGALRAHKAFWNWNGPLRTKATITELIYVEDAVADGAYMLNLQVAHFINDAAPSRPVLYRVEGL